MATLPVIANVFRCALNWTGPSGQAATNVIHIRDESGTATVTDVANELNAAAVPNMWLVTITTAEVTDLAITPLDGIHATQHFAPGTPAHWTGQNGTLFAPACAACVKLTTGLRGRTHRGRVFLPFINQNVNTDGFIPSVDTGTMTTAWQDFADNLSGGAHNLSFGVASYKLAQFNIANGILVEQPLATQRRRQGRLRSA
jgi:hypothetical protein